MFKYTAHPDVIHKYASIQRNAKHPWDDTFRLALQICGSSDAYFQCGRFWRHYRAMEFYSQTRRTEIPLNGVLISADWFTETKI